MANKLFIYSDTIYRETGLTDTDTGDAYYITPSEYDELKANEQEFRGIIAATQTGGSSPTTDITIQTSVDGTNWATWVAGTQITSTSLSVQLLAAATADVCKYVRVVCTLGGSTKATVAAAVKLVSNGKFTVTKVT